MKNIYLIGEHLAHSYSPKIHSYLSDYSYSLKELEREQIPSFLEKREFDGMNVTIPYKKEVIQYLDEISPEAKRIGAVNTILNKNNILIGYNTDYFGFAEMVKSSGTDIKDKKVVIIGSGGVSRAIICACSDMGAESVRVLSHALNKEGTREAFYDAQIIVNATPVGMYPNVGESPIELSSFKECEAVFDIIYNPSVTKLLFEAERLGIKGINGLYMLVAQAKKGAEIFTGEEMSSSLTDVICKKLELESKNIILVGMPGCGKTTVGKLLSKKLSREFYDSDDEVEKEYMKPSDFIIKHGENEFRKAETDVVSRLGKESACVISCGGGVVTRKENYEHLRQNGIVVFLKRDIENLSTSGRPLSKDENTIKQMHRERLPLYRHFCDVEIEMESTSEETAEKILNALKGFRNENTCNKRSEY